MLIRTVRPTCCFGINPVPAYNHSNNPYIYHKDSIINLFFRIENQVGALCSLLCLQRRYFNELTSRFMEYRVMSISLRLISGRTRLPTSRLVLQLSIRNRVLCIYTSYWIVSWTKIFRVVENRSVPTSFSCSLSKNKIFFKKPVAEIREKFI